MVTVVVMVRVTGNQEQEEEGGGKSQLLHGRVSLGDLNGTIRVPGTGIYAHKLHGCFLG
ncbi:MAG: hypothetical protein NO482_07450 [Candidatus Methanomethylicia archaeon]|nr:hypothetical protein [Candidatus Methanomethylicia archaeon]